MSWQQIEVRVSSEDLERAEALLRLAGTEAIGLSGHGEHELFEPEPGESPLWPTVVLRALFPTDAALEPVVAGLRDVVGSSANLSVSTIADEEWLESINALTEPRRVGKRLLLVSADEDPPAFDGIIVRLNIGFAFGTGEHPTTSMCLDWLEAEVSPGETILDYGSGSGILAVTALRLGASQGWATDIDPQALTATKSNARVNDLEARLWVGPPDTLPELQADRLVANILAGTLADLVEIVAQRVRPGGRLGLSGLLTSQTATIREAYSKHFESFKVEEREGWALVSATRRPTPG